MIALHVPVKVPQVAGVTAATEPTSLRRNSTLKHLHSKIKAFCPYCEELSHYSTAQWAALRPAADQLADPLNLPPDGPPTRIQVVALLPWVSTGFPASGGRG